MLTSIDCERSVDNKENIKQLAYSKEKNNVVSFKSSKALENDSRQKAIEAITKRAEQLHW